MKDKTKKINKKTVSEMLAGCRGRLLLGVFGTLGGAVMAYIIPLVNGFAIDYVIGSEEKDLPGFIAKWVDDIGGRDILAKNLWLVAMLIVALTVIYGLFIFVRRRSIAVAAEKSAENMRNNLYTHLQSLPYDYYKHASTGDLVQRCTSDVDTVRRFINNQLLEMARTIFMVGTAAVIMFNIHTAMAFISIAIMPVLTISSFFYFRMVQKQFTKSDEAEGELSSVLQENLTGVRVVRAFGQQQNEIEKFTQANAKFRYESHKLMKLLGFYWGYSDSIGYIQIAASLVAGVLFAVKGDFTIGNIVVFTTYTGMLTWPMRQLGRVLADLGKATVSLGRLEDILNAQSEKEPGKALTPKITGNIEFKKVCFGYERFDDVLNEVSFSVKAGQTVAILGSTGSGKTSLVQLMQRLYTCTAGEIIIDGVNINDIDHGHLRHNIGIVLQEPFLYSRTIMENIKITAPEADDETVYAAAETASVHKVITEFENGYDTVVGERGVTLSGGQKQRVAIARTLMQNTPILILDDSMSAVDTETDAAIRGALLGREGKTTTFIISQRLTTLCRADNILVLDRGRIVQQGTHDRLMAEEGIYKRMAEIQDMNAALELKGGVSDE